MGSTSTRLSLLCCTVIGLAGCGSPDSVTYVDPNPDTLYAGITSTGDREPFVQYGADAAQRAEALVRIRGALASARTIQPTDPRAAARIVASAIETDLPFVEPTLAVNSPPVATELRTRLERLRDDPPGDADGYASLLQDVTGPTWQRAWNVAVPAGARQDDGFRAAVLVDVILEAATRYEEAFAGDGTEPESLDAYRSAYGLLLDARTRNIDSVPERERRTVQARLTRAADRAAPGPTPPSDPRPAELVTAELATVADLVAAAAGVDPTLNSPDPGTPDQLRAVKRSLARAVETWEQGNATAASQQLRRAWHETLVPAGRSVATVDGDLLAQVEQELGITVPTAMRSNGDVVAAAAELDTLLDDAITLVEGELQLLREEQ